MNIIKLLLFSIFMLNAPHLSAKTSEQSEQITPSEDFLKNIIIREAKEDEYPAITTIHIHLWQETYKGIIDEDFLKNISTKLSFEKRLATRKQLLKKPNQRYAIVAVYNETIVGFCEFGSSQHPEHGLGEIHTLYILPDFQKKGIGRLLINEAMQQLKQDNLIPIILLVFKENVSAENFYKKIGFHVIKEISREVGGKIYLENMYCFLDDSKKDKDESKDDIAQLTIGSPS